MATQTGSIDLKAQAEAHEEASQKATKYITELTDGIHVHPEDNPSDGVKIRSDVEIWRRGVKMASYGDDATIGDPNSAHVVIDSMGLKLKYNNRIIGWWEYRNDKDSFLATTISSGRNKIYPLISQPAAVDPAYTTPINNSIAQVEEMQATDVTNPANPQIISSNQCILGTNYIIGAAFNYPDWNQTNVINNPNTELYEIDTRISLAYLIDNGFIRIVDTHGSPNVFDPDATQVTPSIGNNITDVLHPAPNNLSFTQPYYGIKLLSYTDPSDNTKNISANGTYYIEISGVIYNNTGLIGDVENFVYLVDSSVEPSSPFLANHFYTIELRYKTADPILDFCMVNRRGEAAQSNNLMLTNEGDIFTFGRANLFGGAYINGLGIEPYGEIENLISDEVQVKFGDILGSGNKLSKYLEYLYDKVSIIGKRYAASTNTAISNGDMTQVSGSSITVPPGTYIVIGQWTFNTRTTTGMTNSEVLIMSGTETLVAERVTAANNSYNRLNCTTTVALTNTSTLTVKGATSRPTNGAALNFIHAVRIA